MLHEDNVFLLLHLRPKIPRRLETRVECLVGSLLAWYVRDKASNHRRLGTVRPWQAQVLVVAQGLHSLVRGLRRKCVITIPKRHGQLETNVRCPHQPRLLRLIQRVLEVHLLHRIQAKLGKLFGAQYLRSLPLQDVDLREGIAKAL
jgi:hypothetical protein